MVSPAFGVRLSTDFVTAKSISVGVIVAESLSLPEVGSSSTAAVIVAVFVIGMAPNLRRRLSSSLA